MKWAALLLAVLILLTACTPAQSPDPQSVSNPANIKAHVAYIRSAQRSTGAIAMTPGSPTIEPYFANLAAGALLRTPGQLTAVRRYMDWYLDHLNQDGTMDDYQVTAGREVPTGDADSTDSYAATFLSLVASWVKAGGDRQWVVEHRNRLDRVVGAILAVTDRDGLTWSSPHGNLKLLMDNCEVFRGWTDWSRLQASLGLKVAAGEAAARAEQLSLNRFRQADGLWGWAVDREDRLLTSNPEQLYPDAVAQVYPLISGAVSEQDGFRAFNAGQPEWRSLQAGDFPWLLPAYAAALSGDRAGVQEALDAAGERYPALHWPWYIGESAWLIEAATVTSW